MVLCTGKFFLGGHTPPHPPFLKHVKTHRESSYCRKKNFTNKNNRNKDSLENRKSNFSYEATHVNIIFEF